MSQPEQAAAAMRCREEIQMAHDILWSQVTGDTPFCFTEDSRPFMMAALDVLCWVLRHDHSVGFYQVLNHIGEQLSADGFRLMAASEPFVGKKPPPDAVAVEVPWPPPELKD